MTAINPHGIKITAGDQITDSDLPEGWEYIVLRDLVTQRKGKKPKKLDKNPWKGAVPYVDIKAFEMRNIRRYADPNSSVLVDADDVVVVWDGARCGYVGKASIHGALGSTLMTLRQNIIHSDYLLRFLQLSYDTINSNPRGTGIPHVEPELFWNLELPVAPFEEQNRIVAKVEELIARVNAARERLAKVKEILKRFRQSVLTAACSGHLTEDWREKHPDVETASQLLRRIQEERKERYGREFADTKRQGKKTPRKLGNFYETNLTDELPLIPETWIWKKFGNICEKIFDGAHLSPKNSSMGDFMYITAKNIKIWGIDLSNVTYVTKEDHEKIYLHSDVRKNDILYIKDGATTGIATVNTLSEQFSLLSSVGVFRVNNNYILPEFICHFLNSPTTRDRMLSIVSGAAITRLTLIKLNNSFFCLPPFAEQREIVRRVDDLFRLADVIDKRIVAATVRADKLTQAILAKAFRAELVPTEAELARLEGRSYEPASTLLAKIKAQRKDVKPQRKHKRSKEMKN